jgi:hypothetical protein
MTFSDWITIGGAVVTLVGMAVSIVQARSALKSSKVAKNAMTAVQLVAVAERLKSAQEHIRDLATDKVSQRGFKIGNRFDLIRREFDSALSALPKTGRGSEARTQLASAQNQLNNYQKSLQSNPDPMSWQELQIFVQDTISDLTSNTHTLGDKNDY